MLLHLVIVSLYGSIKRHVIFFNIFYKKYCDLRGSNNNKLVTKPSYISNISRGPTGLIGITGKRYYSSSKNSEPSAFGEQGSNQSDSHNKNKSSANRKNLSSPESRPYPDLYKGRGIKKKNVPD